MLEKKYTWVTKVRPLCLKLEGLSFLGHVCINLDVKQSSSRVICKHWLAVLSRLGLFVTVLKDDTNKLFTL